MTKQEMIDKARTTDLVSFLGSYKGFTFIARGSEFRCTEHPSLAIKSDRRSFYWHSQCIGGFGALDFLIKVEHMDFSTALQVILGADTVTATPILPTVARNLILPEKAHSYRQVFAYLCKTRGLDSKIIQELIQKKKLYEDIKGNAVFVGFDEAGIPKYAFLRGTYTEKQFRMDCAGSDKKYGFHMSFDTIRQLYIFESPIDAISHATLENLIKSDDNAWKYDNRLSLGGTSDMALIHYLEMHPHVGELVFCLDSDDVGRTAAIHMARKYASQGYRTRLELPLQKDYNEVLLQYKENLSRAKERNIDELC